MKALQVAQLILFGFESSVEKLENKLFMGLFFQILLFSL